MSLAKARGRTAGGVRRVRRLPAWGRIGVIAAIVGLAAAGFPVSGRARAEVGGLQVQGSQLLLNGQPFSVRGFDMIGVLTPPGCSSVVGQAAAAHFGQAELDAARAWGANTLRFQVSQSGLATSDQADLDSYLAQIESAVALAHANGFVVILSMQDQATGCGTAHPLPDAGTVTAWQRLAPLFAADPATMLELFNEPGNGTSAAGWAQWLNGGSSPLDDQGAAAVGYQQLVTVVRAAGADNVLLADGAQHAESLAGVPLLQDTPGGQGIAYAVHPYNFVSPAGEGGWQARFGYLTASAPVVATEWDYRGASCGTAAPAVAPSLLSYLQASDIGLIAQALDIPGTTVSDWAWDPTQCGTASGGSGALTQAYFAERASTDPLGRPGGVAAVAASPAEVDLTWQAPPDGIGLTGFDVYRDGTLIATLGDTSSYQDTSPAAGTAYSYTVASVDSAGTVSAQSPPVSVTTPASDGPAPPAPTGLTATPAGPAAIQLTWTAGADGASPAAGYYVYRDGVQVATVTSGTSYLDGGLADGTAYTYRVSEYDTAGDVSPQSSAASATTPDVSPPTVPDYLTGLAGSSGITLSWVAASDNVGVAGYHVYRDGGLLATVTGGTSYTDTGLVQGATYSYTVSAFDAAGNESAQTAPCAVTYPDTTPPTPPRITRAVPGTGSVDLTWAPSTDNVGVARYVIYQGVKAVGKVGGQTLTYLVKRLLPGKTYRFHVAAFDAAGNRSANSNVVTVTVK